MSHLRRIFQHLQDDYAVSRHTWWLDESSGRIVNDVTYTLRFVHQTAEGLRRGDEACWRELVVYCIDRSMSYHVMVAIGDYLGAVTALEPLPVIDLSPQPARNGRGDVLPLFDETDRVASQGRVVNPEPDRPITFKHEHQWSPYPPRLKDTHPTPDAMGTTHQSVHWLF